MIGQYATSKAGHDKNTLYVIVAEEKDYIYLSDGRLKTPDSPKKKKRRHVQSINAWVADGLRQRLEAGENVTAEEIRFALKQYH